MFLVFSAFEQYCRCLGIPVYNEAALKQMQDDVDQAVALVNIRAADPNYGYFTFVHEKLDKAGMKAALMNFIGGADVNVSFLGRCGRHIFAHGHMAAGSAGLDEASMDVLSSSICRTLLDAMDLDYERRAASL